MPHTCLRKEELLRHRDEHHGRPIGTGVKRDHPRGDNPEKGCQEPGWTLGGPRVDHRRRRWLSCGRVRRGDAAKAVTGERCVPQRMGTVCRCAGVPVCEAWRPPGRVQEGAAAERRRWRGTGWRPLRHRRMDQPPRERAVRGCAAHQTHQPFSGTTFPNRRALQCRGSEGV